MGKYHYVVMCDFTEGRFMGKGKVVPKNDRFKRGEVFEFEAYQDTQIKAILSSLIAKRYNYKVTYVVNINILKKEPI